MAMSKPAILFIHGFPFDHAMWRHQVVALSRWRCLAPDVRTGQRDSVASYARDLIALLDESGVDAVVVCGLSMGGYISFELLRQVPARVRAVILCNTKAAPDTPEGKRWRDVLAEKARALGAGAVAEELIPKVLARVTREQRTDVVREVREMIERQAVAGIVGTLHALRDRPDSTELLGGIRVPVLVIAGDDDQITPALGMQEMARAIPGARFELIPNAGHLTPLEQPALVNSRLNEFLEMLG